MMRRIALSAACAVLLSGPATAETSPKIAPELAKAMATEGASAHFDVLVYLTEQADVSAAKAQSSKKAKGRFVVEKLRQAQKAQAKLLASVSNAKLAHRSFTVVNAVLVRGADSGQIEALAARGDVAQILADKAFRVVPQHGPEFFKHEAGAKAAGPNIRFTGADRVWTELGKRGEGIVVAGNDTGIEWGHPGLKSHYRGSGAGGVVSHDFNWHDSIHESLTPEKFANPCGYETAAPCDDNGHGTHTLGTMVGDDGAGNQVGMAPGATWIGCRNMDEGIGKPSTYLECFDFFLAPWAHGADPATGDAAKAPDVINNSWGCPTDEGCTGAEFLTALENLAAAGVMVVAAAGNAGSGCTTIGDAPAHHTDEVFVVGALDHSSGVVASFSSRGPSGFDGKVGPDISAPGVSIRSTVQGGGYSGSFWSGTSMAAPHVAGAVALLWSAKPELIGKIPETIARFTAAASAKTTTQTCGGVAGTSIPNNTYGYGSLDVYAAATR